MTTPAPTRSPFPALAPVAIMCLVAAVQVYLATAHHLSPWKGGGFGMFASTDDPGSRFIECVGQTTDGQDVVIRGAFSAFAPGASLTSSSARLIQTFPTESALAAAANDLLSLEFVSVDEPAARRDELFLAQNPDLAPLLPQRPERARLELRPHNPLSLGHAESRRYRLQSVSLRVWRLKFSAEGSALTVHPLIGPITASKDGA